MSVIVGIISYLGSTPDVKEARRDAHNEQLQWFKDQGVPSNEILVASQYYDESDYMRDLASYRDCAFPDSRLKPASARNHLLKELYNTDYDWFILADNDSTLHDESKGHIIQYLQSNDLEGIDMFVPVSANVPGAGAWRQNHEDNKEALQREWRFIKGNTKGSFMFLRNLKKYYGKELYFNDVDYTASEDHIFGYEMTIQGHVVMWCENIILRERYSSGKNACTWGSDVDRKEMENIIKSELYKNFNKHGIVEKTLSNGKKQSSFVKFYKRYTQNNTPIKIDMITGKQIKPKSLF